MHHIHRLDPRIVSAAPRRLAPRLLVALLGLGAVAPAQDAYLHELSNQGWVGVLATEVTQPTAAREEFLMAGTSPAGDRIIVTVIDDLGQPVRSTTVQPPTPHAIFIADLIHYDFGGGELFALLCNSYTFENYLFLFDVKGNLIADRLYAIQHPSGVFPFNAEHLAWDPVAKRLAILGNVTQFALNPDVGLFTTNGMGDVVDEMRWYDFKQGVSLSSCQAFDLAYNPWAGGFLVGVQGWQVAAGFMVFPVSNTGKPLNNTTAWITQSMVAHGLSLDRTNDQVLVYGEVFAFGPGIALSDVCFWMDDIANLQAGTTATATFTRFHNAKDELETVRNGAFSAADPGLYAITGLSNNTPGISWFKVGPGSITLKNRVSTPSFGYVTRLLHLDNYQTQATGYPLDQIITGFTNGHYTAFARRSSTGQWDAHCENQPAKLKASQVAHQVIQPTITVKYTFKASTKLGSPSFNTILSGDVVCDYPQFAAGTAH